MIHSWRRGFDPHSQQSSFKNCKNFLFNWRDTCECWSLLYKFKLCLLLTRKLDSIDQQTSLSVSRKQKVVSRKQKSGYLWSLKLQTIICFLQPVCTVYVLRLDGKNPIKLYKWLFLLRWWQYDSKNKAKI